MHGVEGKDNRQQDLRGSAKTQADFHPRTRCWTCYKPEPLCLCGRVPEVNNRTRITLFQHPRERFHAIGTARLARLGLSNLRFEIPNAPVTRSLALEPDLSPGTGLLFPGPGALNLSSLPSSERPTGLVVLDGTWGQAGKLYRANPWLDGLPRYVLTPASPSRYRIRRAPRAQFISTIEAIVEALKILEPETPGLDGLLEAFDTMIEAQMAFSHRAPRLPLRKIRRQGRRSESVEDRLARD